MVAACGGDDDASDGDDAATEDDGGATAEATDDSSGTDEGDTGDTGDSGDSGDAGTADEDTSDGSPVTETLPPEENAEPVFGGTLRMALEAETNGVNPVTSSLAVSGLQMGNAVFDTLAATTADGGWTPYLAESFTPSDDLKSWTMKLREGISFHDGTPLNADAVIVNFETARADPLVGLAIAPFYPAEGAIAKIDDLTVQFNLADPHAHFPTYLTGQLGMVASPAWLEAAVADPSLNQAPVGTGPFVFESRSEDSITRFVRNEEWWNGDVYLDAIEFLPVPDSDNRVDLFANGDINALHTTNSASTLDLEEIDGVQSILDDSGEESFAMMNTSVPPFDDIRAREALALATPITLYNQLIDLGVNRQASQRFIPESPYYNPDIQPRGDDPDGAAALAAAYCAERGSEQNPVLGQPTCTDGKINIELQWSGPSVVQTRIGDLLDENWSGSFNTTFNEIAQDEHILQTALGQYNVVTWRQFGAEDPAADNVWLLCRTVGVISLNWPRSCDEERDSLLLQAQATEDQSERVPLYQQAEQLIHDQIIYVFFGHTLWDIALDESVKGVCGRLSPEGVELTCATNGRTWFSSAWIE